MARTESCTRYGPAPEALQNLIGSTRRKLKRYRTLARRRPRRLRRNTAHSPIQPLPNEIQELVYYQAIEDLDALIALIYTSESGGDNVMDIVCLHGCIRIRVLRIDDRLPFARACGEVFTCGSREGLRQMSWLDG